MLNFYFLRRIGAPKSKDIKKRPFIKMVSLNIVLKLKFDRFKVSI